MKNNFMLIMIALLVGLNIYSQELISTRLVFQVGDNASDYLTIYQSEDNIQISLMHNSDVLKREIEFFSQETSSGELFNASVANTNSNENFTTLVTLSRQTKGETPMMVFFSTFCEEIEKNMAYCGMLNRAKEIKVEACESLRFTYMKLVDFSRKRLDDPSHKMSSEVEQDVMKLLHEKISFFGEPVHSYNDEQGQDQG